MRTLACTPMTQNGTPVRIRHFTDPSCPFAFSAERQRLRLEWLYGDQLGWSTHMVVLAEAAAAGLPAGAAGAGPQAAARSATGCRWRGRRAPARRGHVRPARAVVAVRRARATSARCGALLRRLRVLYFAGCALDEPDDARAAPRSRPGSTRKSCAPGHGEPEVEAALARRQARRPQPVARFARAGLQARRPAEERRYTCPSYELERTTPAPPGTGRRPSGVDLPGFRPVEAYEAALANLAPELTRRPDPDGVEEVLAWAGMPLATAEVAAVMRHRPDRRARGARPRGPLRAGRRRRLLDPLRAQRLRSPRRGAKDGCRAAAGRPASVRERMLTTVLWLVPATILLAAAALKAADRAGTSVALTAYGVPGRLAAPAWGRWSAVEAALAAGIAAAIDAAAQLAGGLLTAFVSRRSSRWPAAGRARRAAASAAAAGSRAPPPGARRCSPAPARRCRCSARRARACRSR